MLLQRLLLRQAEQCRGLAVAYGRQSLPTLFYPTALSVYLGDVRRQSRDGGDGTLPVGATKAVCTLPTYTALP